MEMWRIIAAVLMTLSGGLLVVGSVGQVRDNLHRRGGDVVRTALTEFAVLATVVALVATVLPATVCWALIVACVLIATILMVTG